MTATMLRRRGPGQRTLHQIKQLDAFSRVQDAFVETTPIGGTLSILAFVVALGLFCSEVLYYLDSKVVFKFSPDTDLDAKLKIKLDITVAMPCTLIGADIVDSTSQNVFAFGELKEEDTWFELMPHQRAHFDSMNYINTYLREEYHAVSELLWKSGEAAVQGQMPPRLGVPDRPHDACRIHGTLVLNKVAGNFHITMGKSLHMPGGHIHLSMLFGEESYNFSHRINQLSFGDSAPGLVHPLEGDEKMADVSAILYQYFIDIVPVEVDTAFSKIKTYQYSAKELARPINHRKGSHGTPGIFFKYDIAPLKLKVSQERDNPVQFAIRLFSIVGGIYVITGYVNSIVVILKRIFTSKAHRVKYDELK